MVIIQDKYNVNRQCLKDISFRCIHGLDLREPCHECSNDQQVLERLRSLLPTRDEVKDAARSSS